MNDRVWNLSTKALLTFLLLTVLVACSEAEPTAIITTRQSVAPEVSATSEATLEPNDTLEPTSTTKSPSEPTDTREASAIPTINPTPTSASKPPPTAVDQEADYEFVLLATLQDEQADDPYDDMITRLDFAPDGQTLASGHGDGTVRIWDITTGTILHSLEAGEADVRAVEFTPDGESLVTVGVFFWGANTSAWNTVHVWDVATGRQLYGIETRLAVENMAISPDGRTLAVATWETGHPGSMGKVSLFDLASGGHIRDLGMLSNPAFALAYAPDGNSIAASGWLLTNEDVDSQIFVWDPDTGETRFVAKGHTDWVGDLAFAGDGQTLVSISFDDTIGLWDAESGEQQLVLAPPAGQKLAGLASSPHSQLIAALTDQFSVVLWDVGTGKEVGTFQEPGGVALADWPLLYSPGRLAFSPDGTLLATGTAEGLVHLWGLPGSLDTLDSVESETGDSPAEGTGQSGGAALTPTTTLTFDSISQSDLAMSLDGQTLACNCYDSVRVWDIPTGQDLATLEADPGRSSGSLAFSPDNITLASAQFSGEVILWDLATQEREATINSELRLTPDDSFPDGVIAFSPEGRLLVHNRPGELSEWNPVTGEQEPVMDNLWSLQAIEYLQDGRGLVVTSGYDEVIIFDLGGSFAVASLSQDLDTGEFTMTDLETGGEADQLQYPYGISPGTTEIAVLNLETGEEIARIDPAARLGDGLAFSPDGTQMALGTMGGMIQLWDLETQLEVATLPAGVLPINSLAFSPDGQLLASGGEAGVIRLWDLASGTELANVQVKMNGRESRIPVSSLLFTPDGETLISGGEDMIQFWSVTLLTDD